MKKSELHLLGIFSSQVPEGQAKPIMRQLVTFDAQLPRVQPLSRRLQGDSIKGLASTISSTLDVSLEGITDSKSGTLYNTVSKKGLGCFDTV